MNICPRTSLLSLTFLALALGAASDDTSGFKSAPAKSANKEYLARVAKIQAEADIKFAAARKEYAAALQAAQKAATRSGDLDEGVRIRDAISETLSPDQSKGSLDGVGWQPRAALASRLTGTTWSAGNPLKFNADGTTNPQPNDITGRWAPIGKRQVVVVFSSGVTEILEFDADVTTYKGTATTGGTGVKGQRTQ